MNENSNKASVKKTYLFIRCIFIALLPFTLSACMSMVQSIVGIKDARLLSNEEIYRYSKKLKIDQKNSYRLDTLYLNYLLKLDSIRFKDQIKNHYQPLQALYYTANGELSRFYVNCYAGGFPQLKWNRNGMLNTFPPQNQAPVDSIVSLKTLSQFLQPIPPESTSFLKDSSDYTVVVFWNVCTKRHSKHLIKSIRKNCSLAPPLKVKTVYVNYDAVFYAMEHK